MKTPAPALIGDGIKNPHNAQALLGAAALFGTHCLFRNRNGLADGWSKESPLALVTAEQIAQDYRPVMLLENLKSAEPIFGFRQPKGPMPALVAGNERRGIARDLQAIGTQAIEIPLFSKALNTLNVAAAAGVALYYLCTQTGPIQMRPRPEQKRPEIFLLGPQDHGELGSALRSAAAFGWARVFVDDRANVWFDVDRITKSEGRAAARRGRNSIRVIPANRKMDAAFSQVTVIVPDRGDIPLHRANLAIGPRQAVVVPDAAILAAGGEDWNRFGAKVQFAGLGLSGSTEHFRIPTSIALAEIARQVGRKKKAGPGRPHRQVPLYDHALRTSVPVVGEKVYFDDLLVY